jgi:hypothetical protein
MERAPPGLSKRARVSDEMDEKDDQIAHHRIQAGKEIPTNYGRNNNSPATGLIRERKRKMFELPDPKLGSRSRIPVTNPANLLERANSLLRNALPDQAKRLPKSETNSFADCGRAAVFGLRARSKNCCHSAGASGK